MDLEGRLSEWIAGHSRAFGIALALLSGVCGTVVLTLREPFGSEQPSDALAYVLLWGVSLCLVFFRSNPLPALVVSALLTLVYWVRDYPDYYQVAFVFAFYAATRRGGEDRRSVWRVVGLGLLRAVGMTRPQMHRMVRWEAAIISGVGALLGAGVGIAFGALVVFAAPEEFLNNLAIPWFSLAISVIVASLAGLIAGFLPARRAGKLNVLDAIAS